MQESFNFGNENFLTSIFFSFLEKQYFNFFLSFAASRSSFINLSLPKGVYNEVAEKLKTYKAKGFLYYDNGFAGTNRNYFEVQPGEVVFCNLHSFFKKNIESELRFLDFFKTLSPKGISFLGISCEDEKFEFILNDVKSRFNAAIPLRFMSDTPFDFYELAFQFLSKNGMSVSPDTLKFMMLHINRDILSFSIFIEELVRFIQESALKVTRQNFKIIYERYEERRNQAGL